MNDGPDLNSALRMIPSVDELLRSAAAAGVLTDPTTAHSLRLAREAIEMVRREIADVEQKDADRAEVLNTAMDALRTEIAKLDSLRQKRVINATGVIVHTNLGRAPLSREAIEAVVAAAGYCSLEYDIKKGSRGQRAAGAEAIAAKLAGAEAAIIVNNGAAAAFLVLSTFCKDRDVIVSRGELVEIGGDFRIPDVLTQAGARLKEVGTTNRTKIGDYRAAINAETVMILRVHPSNYRITGFTAAPKISETAALAASEGLLSYEDAGSGALISLSRFGLGDEPVIAESIRAGCDLVSFSGDKLLGGVQAGIVVGRAELISQMRKHPLYRALRPDKLTIAATEATLRHYLNESALENIPALQMLSAAKENLHERGGRIFEAAGKSGELRLEMVDGGSTIGGGAGPDLFIEGSLIAVSGGEMKAAQIEEKLRGLDPPIIARVADERVLIDLRTIRPDEDDLIVEGLRHISN